MGKESWEIEQFFEIGIGIYPFLIMVLGDVAEAGLCNPTVERWE